MVLIGSNGLSPLSLWVMFVFITFSMKRTYKWLWSMEICEKICNKGGLHCFYRIGRSKLFNDTIMGNADWIFENYFGKIHFDQWECFCPMLLIHIFVVSPQILVISSNGSPISTLDISLLHFTVLPVLAEVSNGRSYRTFVFEFWAFTTYWWSIAA